MSINTELMQQVVADLNNDKKFIKERATLEKQKERVAKVNNGEVTSVAATVLGTAAFVGNAIADFLPSYEYNNGTAIAGAVLFGAGLVGLSTCEKIKEYIGIKQARTYNSIYSKVQENYIEKVNEQNPEVTFTEQDYLDEVIDYQNDTGKVFDIKDFEIETEKEI